MTPAPDVRTDQRTGDAVPATVGDIMTEPVVTAYRGAAFDTIAGALSRNEINAVPVIDENRHVVGIVTASDLLTRFASGTVPPGITADELMTAPVVTTTAAEPVAGVAQVFTHRGVRSMPVVDEAGTLVAMVSRRDVLRAVRS